jgi:hypothetical protein
MADDGFSKLRSSAPLNGHFIKRLAGVTALKMIKPIVSPIFVTLTKTYPHVKKTFLLVSIPFCWDSDRDSCYLCFLCIQHTSICQKYDADVPQRR